MHKLFGFLVAATISISAAEAHERIFFTPFDNGQAEANYVGTLQHAEKYIHVISYGFTDSAVCDELIAAKKRGCEVKVIMDATQAAGPNQVPIVNRLKHASIPVLIGKSPNHGQLIHQKSTVIDGELVEFGSWNYSGDTASEQINVLALNDDPAMAQGFEDNFQQVWQAVTDHQAAQAAKRHAHGMTIIEDGTERVYSDNLK